MAKAVLSEQAAASTQNIYQLDGKVPLLKAIPFGLQHILAMFVSNLTGFIFYLNFCISLYIIYNNSPRSAERGNPLLKRTFPTVLTGVHNA